MTITNGILQFQGEKSPSIASKVVIICLYLIGVAGAVWLTHFAINEGDRSGNLGRQVMLLTFTLIYIVRAAITLFVFVKRKIPWWEALWGGVGIGFTLFLLMREGIQAPQPLGFMDLVGVLLYLTGSYVGTSSEYSRHLWKIYPKNQGHLYTEGLFRYCRHINYFGDLLLFCGFALLTRQLWTGIMPLVMFLQFVLAIIPAHDAYLAIRYNGEFDEYARRARKLVPFLYCCML